MSKLMMRRIEYADAEGAPKVLALRRQLSAQGEVRTGLGHGLLLLLDLLNRERVATQRERLLGAVHGRDSGLHIGGRLDRNQVDEPRRWRAIDGRDERDPGTIVACGRQKIEQHGHATGLRNLAEDLDVLQPLGVIGFFIGDNGKRLVDGRGFVLP